jgi:hypothetical protein
MDRSVQKRKLACRTLLCRQTWYVISNFIVLPGVSSGTGEVTYLLNLDFGGGFRIEEKKINQIVVPRIKIIF